MLGKISASFAIVVGGLIGAFAALQAFSWGFGVEAAPLAAVGAALVAGGLLALIGLAGSKRFLAGAWGVVVGLYIGPEFSNAVERRLDPALAEGSYAIDPGVAVAVLLYGLPWLAIVCIFLLVFDRVRSRSSYRTS